MIDVVAGSLFTAILTASLGAAVWYVFIRRDGPLEDAEERRAEAHRVWRVVTTVLWTLGFLMMVSLLF